MYYIAALFLASANAMATNVNGNMAQSGIMNNSKTKLNVAGKHIKQNLNGSQEGIGNNGKISSTLTTGIGGSTDTIGQFQQLGFGNKGLLKVNNKIGAGGNSNTVLTGSTEGIGNSLDLKSNNKLGAGAVGASTLIGSASGLGNFLGQTANSKLKDGAVSAHHLISSIDAGNIGVSNSTQLGGKGTVKTANIVDNINGNGLKINGAKQNNCADGTCTINGIHQLTGKSGVVVNSFDNGGTGTINSMVQNSNAIGSSVFNFVPGAQTGASTDKNGNTILNIAGSLDTKGIKASQLMG
jgi:hypothetical protein